MSFTCRIEINEGLTRIFVVAEGRGDGSALGRARSQVIHARGHAHAFQPGYRAISQPPMHVRSVAAPA